MDMTAWNELFLPISSDALFPEKTAPLSLSQKLAFGLSSAWEFKQMSAVFLMGGPTLQQAPPALALQDIQDCLCEVTGVGPSPKHILTTDSSSSWGSYQSWNLSVLFSLLSPAVVLLCCISFPAVWGKVHSRLTDPKWLTQGNSLHCTELHHIKHYSATEAEVCCRREFALFLDELWLCKCSLEKTKCLPH